MKFACCMVAFAGGVLAGGIMALLFAPKRGDEMRRDIKKHADEALKHIKDEISCCKPGSQVIEEDISLSLKE